MENACPLGVVCGGEGSGRQRWKPDREGFPAFSRRGGQWCQSCLSLVISIPHDSLSELRLPWAHGHAHSYTHMTCLKLRAPLQGKLCSWALCLSQGSCNAASLLTVTKAKKQSPPHSRTPARGPLCTSWAPNSPTLPCYPQPRPQS